MTTAQQNARQGACEQMPPSPPGSRHGWYYAECPVHGRTEHLTYLGGRCAKCQDEALVKAAGETS